MTFTENDLIFPSKKIYENIKNIDNTIFSLLYTQAPYFEDCLLVCCSEMRSSINNFNKALDQVENSISKIKKVKISETVPFSFINEFPAISQFYIEASVLENMTKTPVQKRFYNLAIRLWDLGVYPKET